MQDQLTQAAVDAAETGAPPKLWHAGPDAVIQLAEGAGGHLLTGATVTAWDLPDVMTGRSE